MPRNNNYTTVKTWVKTNKVIQVRKFYSLEEFYRIFKNDSNIDTITLRGFSRNINKCAENISNFERIETSYRNFSFITTPFGTSRITPNTRISSRGRGVSDVSHTNLSTMIQPQSPPQLHLPDSTSTSNDRSSNNHENQRLSDIIRQMKKLDLPVALSFFLGKKRAEKIIEEEDGVLGIKSPIHYSPIVTEHIKTQIKKLQVAHLTSSGWKNIIQDYDKNDKFFEHDIFALRMKAFYLQNILTKALNHYNDVSDFNHIAAMAIFETNNSMNVYEGDETQCMSKHLSVITNVKTLLSWFRTYRDYDSFPNLFKKRSRKSNTPYFLAENPDATAKIINYCKENVDVMTMESVHTFIHNILLPNTVQQIQIERNDFEYDIEALMSEFHINKLTVMTVWSWLRHLGFSYQQRKKSYYVDNHELPVNVTYRSEFITRYFKYELRCHRWITISEAERNGMVEEGQLVSELGYFFEKNNAKYYEFHVDDHEIFQNACSHLPYGGYLSIRMPLDKKPLMLLGQDECIFKQYIFTKGVWVLPDGTRELVPKEEGHGVMLSSLCSRELGYGFELSKETLDKVNKLRERQHYSDKAAATLQNGTTVKPKLTVSPFDRRLEYGNGLEGYWSYEQSKSTTQNPS